MELAIYRSDKWCIRDFLKFIISNATSVFKESTGTNKRDRMLNIIDTHSDLISRICFGYSHTKEEFEDMRQDAYANIWTGLDKFRGDSSMKTWIYRVTLNTCVSVVRKKSKNGQTIDIAEIADPADLTDEKSMRIAELYRAIDRLSSIDKAVVMLWLDELSYEEIAETTGLTKNTVAVRLHRAKQRLKLMI